MVTALVGRLGGLFLSLLLALAPGLSGPAAAAIAPPEAAAAEAGAAIERIEGYLNDLDTARARVVQINPDGTRATGTLYLSRPERLRLEYDRPSRVLIVAKDGQLVYHDPKLNQLSYLRVNSTPLAFLLTDEIRLGGNVEVTDFRREGGELRVTLTRADDPGVGRITLTFAESPLELRGWTVTDPQGLTTYVILEDLKRDVALNDDLFVFINPKILGGNRR